MLNGNGEARQRMERIADSRFAAGAARLMQLIGLPAGLALLGWLANGMVELKAEMLALQRQIDAQFHELEHVVSGLTR